MHPSRAQKVSNLGFHCLSTSRFPSELLPILGRGLKFIPPTPVPKISTIDQSLDMFFRSLSIQHQFNSVSSSESTRFISQFYVPNKAWTPKLPQVLGDFKAKIRLEIHARFSRVKPLVNTKPPWYVSALQELKNHPELRVIATDKNLGLAVIDNDDYKRLCLDHLSDNTTYHLESRPAHEIKQAAFPELQDIVEFSKRQFKDIKSIDVFLDKSFDESTSVPLFHCLAKVHKSPLKGRPIAGAVNWITTPISSLLSFTLRPHVQKLDHILRDSMDFITKCEGIELESSDLFVSLDIVSLYPSMDQQHTILAVNALETDDQNLHKFLVESTRSVLKNAYVEFDNSIYQQIKGMPMGTNAAVELANLYVNHWIENHPEFQRVAGHLIRLWKRFIDDIFMIWKGTRAELHEFLELLNSLDPNIKFTAEIHQQESVFLDVVAYRNENKLAFRVFQKPINKYLYITYDSNHPSHVKRAFIKGELIRYIRNSTCIQDFNQLRALFRLRLLARGYPAWFFDQVSSSILYEDRAKYLQGAIEKVETHRKVFLSLPFHPIYSVIGLKPILLDFWPSEPPFNGIQPVVAYSRQPNISDLVTSSRFGRVQQ